MDKPFAILEQKQNPESQCSKTCEPSEVQNTIEFHVRAIVKKKLLFSDRPKPIIANVPKIV